MMVNDFGAWRANALAMVEAGLEGALAAVAVDTPPEASRLVEAMRYALLGGGKRLRPLLALAAAHGLGGGPGRGDDPRLFPHPRRFAVHGRR